MTYITVSGAYGRDYKSLKAAQEDWAAGKDFIIRDIFHGGTYINRDDAEKIGAKVNVRYAADTKVGILK